ncbi:MAG: HlyC/CorC family transporter [Hyphomicrobiales bacterium]|nr:HlyC/CorC family transporter [Hyphomicrobiales bacterium]
MHEGPSISVDPWFAGAIIVICIMLSAFFAGSETAMTAASRARLHAAEQAGDKRAMIANRLIAMRDRFIGAMLLGNTLVNIASSAVATSLLVAIFGERGAIYATLMMTAVLLIFAEVLPKTLAINYPDRMSLIVAPVARFFVAIFSPVLVAVEAVVRGVLRAIGVRIGEPSHQATADDLKNAVDLMHKEGGVARDDRDMVGGLLDLKDLTVSDVMVHRTKMAALDADEPAEKIVDAALASPYTRLPVWRGEPENIIGVLHAKDLLRALKASGGVARLDIDAMLLKPWFVPATTALGDQLQAFRRRKTHFALVVDEYGVVLGLVTLEDILEEIVGEISDEHDVSVQGVRPAGDGGVIVDGAVPIRDLNRMMDWRLPDDEATTIAGLVIHEAQMIPEPGQTFNFHGFRFAILRKTRNRLSLLRVTPAEN